MKVFVAFDIETTGLDPKTAQITEIAAYKFDRWGREIGRFSTLVNPGKPIPAAVRSKIPITDRMVQLAPDPATAVAAFKAFVGDGMLVGHNCDFDLNFVSAVDPSLAGREMLDTFHLAKHVIPGRASYSLVNITKDQGLDRFHVRPHRAWSDAYVTAKLFGVLVNVVENMPAADVAALRASKGANPGPWATFLNDVVRGDGVEPPDPTVASARAAAPPHFVAWWTRNLNLPGINPAAAPSRSPRIPDQGPPRPDISGLN